MPNQIDEILQRIHQLEAQIEAEVSQLKEGFNQDFHEKRMRFEQEVIEQQKRFKIGLLKYLASSNIRSFIVAPFTYGLIFPLLLLDIFISTYQMICFSVLGIRKVNRSDHFVFDRAHLAYLNLFEKINCAYCSYGNGLISFTREIAGRTEQYWCPIKHAKRVFMAHPHYKKFAEYADAENYQNNLRKMREELLAHRKKTNDSRDD